MPTGSCINMAALSGGTISNRLLGALLPQPVTRLLGAKALRPSVSQNERNWHEFEVRGSDQLIWRLM